MNDRANDRADDDENDREEDPAGTCVRVTVSIGVAALDRVGSELTTLLAAADAALYHAKQDGRNQTRVATARPLAQIIPAARPAPLIRAPSIRAPSTQAPSAQAAANCRTARPGQ